MTPPDAARREGHVLPRLLTGVVVAGVLIAQAALYVDSQRDAFAQNRTLADAAWTRNPPSWGSEPLALYDDLLALQKLVPPDARVLLVTSVVIPVAYDFYLLPRSLRLLYAVDALEARAAQLPAPAALQVREWIALLDGQGRRLDAASLRARLAEADCLVTVMLDPDALPWPDGEPAPRLIGRTRLAEAFALGAPP